ncbi:thermonuclease family protein [Patescibacteria group bacterium]
MQYKTKRNSIIVGIVFLIGILVGGKILVDKQIIFKGAEYAIVIEVIDGDTIVIETGEHVRLIGIDAPEKNKCYYNESKEFLKDMILNKSVRLEKDISNKDDYGRLLRYILLPTVEDNADDELINNTLVRQGYALSQYYPPDAQHRGLLSSSQSIAVENKLGIWQECHYFPVENDRELDMLPTNEKCIIKGNVSESNYGKIYFLPECGANYERVKIDPRLGDKYFCTEQEAVDAGFKKAYNCPQDSE